MCQAELGSAAQAAIDREREVLEAVFARDRRRMSELMAPEGLGVDGTMGCVSQRALIDAIDSLDDGADFTMERPVVAHVDDEVAVLAYRLRQQGRFAGVPLPPLVHCSGVWACREGAWTALFHHETLAGPLRG
jgi:uncharacterized protein DUF4440